MSPHPHAFRATQGRKVDLIPNLKKIFSSMRKYFVPLLFSTIMITISVVLSILAPQWLSKLTDEIVSGAASNHINMDKILEYGLILVVFYGINAFMAFGSGFIMNTVTQLYSRDLRNEIASKINRMKLKYFDGHASGDILSIVTNDIDTIGQSMQQSITSMIQSIFMLIGVLIAMFITSWQMALATLISIPLMTVLLIIITKFAMPRFRKRQEEIGEMNGIVEENFTGQLIIKAFNAEKTKGADFDECNHRLHHTMFSAQIFGGLMQPMMSFISYFAYAAVCLTGGLLLANQAGITFGTITAFMVYVNLFQSPLSQIAQSMNTLQMAAAAGDRVFAFLEEEELEDESHKTKKIDQVKGNVKFDHIQFGYSSDKIIIPDFSIDIKAGMKVAIVGPTGAGKTTIVNLLMRFYELNKGTIMIDGVPIQDMTRQEVRDLFGMVLQDTWIFNGTVRENIVYSKKNVSEKELEYAIHEANLSHYIATLPHGVDTILNEESSLSSGQKQLITIARALVENAPLLILDEATSNVDTRTEILIQEAMDRLTKGRTSFVIAHRLSTIKNADLILVMNEGNIIEQGTHESLMEKDGFYASLYLSQFENAE